MIIMQHSKEIPQLSKIYVDERFLCYGLDPRVLNPGTYNLKVTYSPKFKTNLPLITGATVGPERGLRVHAGNTLKDSSGCILVGDTIQIDSDGNIKILNSKKTLSKFMQEEQCQLLII